MRARWLLAVVDYLVFYRSGHMIPVLRLTIATVLAAIALNLYSLRPFDANQVTPKTVLLIQETWNGRPFTAWTVPQIGKMIADYQKAPLSAHGACEPVTILWHGNSQLHTIKEE